MPLGPKGPAAALFPDNKSDMYNSDLSPDGRWLRPFPDVNSGRWQVSAEGGSRPVWSRSGRELFFFSADNRMTVVAVQPAATA